ncbi:hypothetical protein PPL_07634 [Heterostelium album PN500]|uniref:RING-type domain-containing protein n=1 Tax=Heterostelium pallidum (strain ATCC 26659 / Pp 5 / PN500) TaxID=670386 RepID=D3BGI2_HETP5|nr:hypothetical protein PPL_07634 [Heterostelium album PN500]EFA79582.1 hypothetical protein PPL_07634 [Heterostelium album PN500]|eukprot:XP_020431703.1 hypothetical protein PPL_07634 [Heterostelium album PN500]
MEDMYPPVQVTQVSSEAPNIINHSSDNSTIIRSTTVLPDATQLNPNILVPVGFSTPSPLRKSQRRGSFSSILRRRSSIVSMARRASKDVDISDERMAKFLNTISLRTTTDSCGSDDSGSCYSDIASNVDIADYDQNDWFLQEDDIDDEPLFTILEKQELENKIIEMAETLSSQIDLSPGIAILLLIYFRWDQDKILGNYFDDPEQYCLNAGAFLTKAKPNYTGVPCLICYELFPQKELYSLNCGHGPYCLNCWKTYLHEEIMTTGPEVIHSTCISPRCKCKLNFENWKTLASQRDYSRYWYFIAKDYVYHDKHLVFCPNPTCGSAIKYQGVGRPNDVVEYFLLEALELLIECRRILKYTYVFGFYLGDNVPGKMFFEYQQANAEGITELLSEGVYINVALINPEEMKNRIRVTRKYIDNLVKSIEEGLGLDSNMGLAPQE